MHIDIDTKMITLLGKPLAQSFAAAMQNNAYDAAGINMLYFYTETTQEYLESIISGIRHMNYAGFAVTKPNKIEVLKYLDELDPVCKTIGACNTVVCASDGRLMGYNTDGLGFYKSLAEDGGYRIAGSTAFCAGAGGVGRPICFTLAEHQLKKLYIMDLDKSAALLMAADLREHFPELTVEVSELGDFSCLAECGLLINASGVGMGNTIGKSPIPAAYIKPCHFCFDACYNPAKTQFLLDAERAGSTVMNGLNMSLYQGAAQIELWSGAKVSAETMRKALEQAMRTECK